MPRLGKTPAHFHHFALDLVDFSPLARGLRPPRPARPLARLAPPRHVLGQEAANVRIPEEHLFVELAPAPRRWTPAPEAREWRDDPRGRISGDPAAALLHFASTRWPWSWNASSWRRSAPRRLRLTIHAGRRAPACSVEHDLARPTRTRREDVDRVDEGGRRPASSPRRARRSCDHARWHRSRPSPREGWRYVFGSIRPTAMRSATTTEQVARTGISSVTSQPTTPRPAMPNRISSIRLALRTPRGIARTKIAAQEIACADRQRQAPGRTAFPLRGEHRNERVVQIVQVERAAWCP